MRRLLVVTLVVLVSGSVVAPATLFTDRTAAQSSDEIDSCTTITESGEYELTDDISGDDDTWNCIEIRADDVTLDGNGYAVEAEAEGFDGNSGIYVNGSDDVEVRNVEVRGWEHGFEATRSSELSLVDVASTGNLQHGVSVTGGEGDVLSIQDSRFYANFGSGVFFNTEGRVEMADTVVRGNGVYGIVAFNAPVTMDNVSVSGSEGLELNAFHGPSEQPRGSSITASDLQFGDVELSATTDFENESLNVDSYSEDELPALPENVSAAGDGIEFSPIDDEVELELEIETDDETVDLWRHDGEEWETVAEDLTVSDGSIETTVSENGTYAPVTTNGDGDEPTEPSDQDGEKKKNESTPSDRDGDKDHDEETCS